MFAIKIEGSKNVANTGYIQGDCITNSTIINFNLFELYENFVMNDSEKETSLVNITEAQKKIAEAIDKFAQAELIRAKADENNSLANLNYSKIMIEDREIIKQLMDKLK